MRIPSILDLSTLLTRFWSIVIALPLYLAARVRLPLSQKLALGGIFSLGVIIMVFAVIRIVVTNRDNTHPEVSWLNLWSQIEASVAVIISSLAPFKSFFTTRKIKSFEDGDSPPMPHGNPKKSSYPAALQLDERSKEFAVHKHGSIGLSGKGDSTERILRAYEGYGKSAL